MSRRPGRSTHRVRTLLPALVAGTLLVVGSAPAGAALPPDPTLAEPTASEPAPHEPAPSEPAPSEPAPSEPAPSEPAASEPAPSEPAASEPAPSEPVPSPASDASRVGLAGVELTVPDGWSVVDLAAHPDTCVRFDVHVVYLGTPGDPADCPSVLVGRTEAALVQPVPAELPYGTVTLTPGTAVRLTAAQRLAGEVVARVAGTDALVTVTLGSEPQVATALLESLTATSDPAAASLSSQSLASSALPAPLHPSFTWHYGLGFDACTAPSLSAMQAWLASPYRSIGIYVGGGNRGCSQPNLTASWVRSIAGLGWKAQPIYVGPQAACYTGPKPTKIVYGQEWTQGRDAALDAIARAQALGIGTGSDIWYDMESYPQSPECSGSVRAFLSSWTSTLNYNGWSSGVYSSASTGIEDLATGFGQPGYVPPDKIWIARWSGVPDVYGQDAYVSDTLWSPYRRIHQYRGDHDETYGGVTINIDNDVLDTDANRGNPIGRVERATGGPSKVTATGWALDPDSTGPIIVQMYVDGAPSTMTWANLPRPDVGSAFPANGPDHGFTLTGSTTPGWHTVCLYAVNTGPGFSTGLGCSRVLAQSSDPFGQVDAVRADAFTVGPGTVTASGWAIDPDTSAPVIVQMYVDGSANTMAWANRARPDVGAAFPAYGPNHGYSLTLATSPGAHRVCLIAVNTGPGSSRGLGCRDVVVPPRDPFGQLESVTATAGTVTARGWAIDPDTTGPVIVQLYLDGTSWSMAWANRTRTDVERYFPAYGPNHGYELSIAAGRGRHTACVYAVNVGAGASSGLGCRTVDVP